MGCVKPVEHSWSLIRHNRKSANDPAPPTSNPITCAIPVVAE